ncbi:MAG: hypothetical protein NVSMB47_12530 [Polyangiales bacterium]
MSKMRVGSAALLAGTVVVAHASLASDARADATYRAPEYGYSYGENEQPRTLAMGGAARAWGWSTSAIGSNPANLVAQRVYHFEGLFGLDAKAHRLSYGGAILDSITSRLAMGVMGVKSSLGNDTDTYQRGSLDVKAAVAYPLSEKVGFGLTGRYLRVTQDGTGPLGEGTVSRSSGDDPNFRTITFDAGLSFALGEVARLGLVGYNLTSTGSPLAPLMFGGGLGAKLGDLTVEGNVVGVDKTTWGSWKTRAQAGGEYLVGDHYPLRLGYSFDQGSKRHAVSWGVGYVDRQFAIDAGFRDEVAGPSDPWGKAFLFTVGLRYFYETGGAPEAQAVGF